MRWHAILEGKADGMVKYRLCSVRPPRRALLALLVERICLRGMLAVLTLGLVPQPAPVRLDPLALVATKGAQTCTRRPYRPPAQNAGLQTATLALG